MQKIKVYLSGPISGLPDAKERFKKAQAQLEYQYYDAEVEVVNPFDIPHESYKWEDLMLDDLAALKSCTHLCRIEGWSNSPGARIETEFAQRIGLTIFDML